jgi:hypothetical protein
MALCIGYAYKIMYMKKKVLPESDERITLRKLRIKLNEIQLEVEDEILNQGADIASILEEIANGIALGIEDLNDAMESDANGNDKPEN